MGFRTVIVSSRCKLECRLNYLVLRGETERKIHLGEINTLIVQSTASGGKIDHIVKINTAKKTKKHLLPQIFVVKS